MSDQPSERQRLAFTIGHSNHELQTFLDLLAAHEIDVLVDVRSSPYSQYTSYFSQDALQLTLPAHGVKYLFLGNLIGGRPDGDEFYDEEGYVRYDRLAESPPFRQGMDRLAEGVEKYRVAIMCGEEDPMACHRRLLIGRVLARRGVTVQHIRGDGSLESETQIAEREKSADPDAGQLTLFDVTEKPEWKSTQSVLEKKRPPSSSER